MPSVIKTNRKLPENTQAQIPECAEFCFRHAFHSSGSALASGAEPRPISLEDALHVAPAADHVE